MQSHLAMLPRLLRLFGLSCREPEEVKVPRRLEGAGRAAVVRLATGDQKAHAEAVAAYHEVCQHSMDHEGDPAMLFMHEVLHPNPDLNLRALMRQRVLMQ